MRGFRHISLLYPFMVEFPTLTLNINLNPGISVSKLI